jgi:hypothetical protein
MSSVSSIVGSRINLVSNRRVRYEGILKDIDPEKQTVTLKSVVVHGTEGRASALNLPEIDRHDDIYEYVVFNKKDIYDLSVIETPEQVALHHLRTNSGFVYGYPYSYPPYSGYYPPQPPYNPYIHPPPPGAPIYPHYPPHPPPSEAPSTAPNNMVYPHPSGAFYAPYPPYPSLSEAPSTVPNNMVYPHPSGALYGSYPPHPPPSEAPSIASGSAFYPPPLEASSAAPGSAFYPPPLEASSTTSASTLYSFPPTAPSSVPYNAPPGLPTVTTLYGTYHKDRVQISTDDVGKKLKDEKVVVSPTQQKKVHPGVTPKPTQNAIKQPKIPQPTSGSQDGLKVAVPLAQQKEPQTETIPKPSTFLSHAPLKQTVRGEEKPSQHVIKQPKTRKPVSTSQNGLNANSPLKTSQIPPDLSDQYDIQAANMKLMKQIQSLTSQMKELDTAKEKKEKGFFDHFSTERAGVRSDHFNRMTFGVPPERRGSAGRGGYGVASSRDKQIVSSRVPPFLHQPRKEATTIPKSTL